LDPSYWSQTTIGQVPIFWLPYLLVNVFFVLGQAIVLYGAVQHMRQKPVWLSEGLKIALMRFFPLEWIGPLGSLTRSRQLTNGHRWKLFATFLLVAIPMLTVFGMIFAMLIDINGGLQAFAVRMAGGGSMPVPMLIVEMLGFVTVTAFFWVLMAVTYHDLRIAYEGLDTGQVSTVFE
jgi:hypothetical protein